VRAGLLGGARAATATRSCGTGSGNFEVELTTGDVVGIEAFAAPTWTSKYMAWKRIREKVEISKLRSCGLEGRTHRDGLAELAGLFETFGKDVRLNKKSRMHTDKLGRTYRYVVCEMENRYGNVGAGQIRGRREIGRLREQQDNVTSGIWYGKGKSAGISTCIKNSPGWLKTRLDDLPMWSTTEAGAGPA
jgi:hypothetical protein